MSASTQKPRSGDAGLPRNVLAAGGRGEARSKQSPQKVQASDLVAYDGTTAVGWVRRYGGTFVAYDMHGKLRGRFATQLRAMRGYEAYTVDDISLGFFPTSESAVAPLTAAMGSGA